MKTIKDLRDFYAGIPEQSWTVYELETDNKKRCAIGHLNFHLHGSAYYKMSITDGREGYDTRALLSDLKISMTSLIVVNNAGYPWYASKEYMTSLQMEKIRSYFVIPAPKARVLAYLDDLIVNETAGV